MFQLSNVFVNELIIIGNVLSLYLLTRKTTRLNRYLPQVQCIS